MLFKRLKLSLVAFALSSMLSACAGTTTSYVIPLDSELTQTEYVELWDSANRIVSKYFTIESSDKSKGLILTKIRVDRDASGKESKRAYISIQPTDEKFDVVVDIPYVEYEKYENVYSDTIRDGKQILVVERKKIEPKTKTDIYLEALIKSEILKKSKK